MSRFWEEQVAQTREVKNSYLLIFLYGKRPLGERRLKWEKILLFGLQK